MANGVILVVTGTSEGERCLQLEQCTQVGALLLPGLLVGPID